MSEVLKDSQDDILQHRIDLLEAYVDHHPTDRTGRAELNKHRRQLNAIFEERRAALEQVSQTGPKAE